MASFFSISSTRLISSSMSSSASSHVHQQQRDRAINHWSRLLQHRFAPSAKDETCLEGILVAGESAGEARGTKGTAATTMTRRIRNKNRRRRSTSNFRSMAAMKMMRCDPDPARANFLRVALKEVLLDPSTPTGRDNNTKGFFGKVIAGTFSDVKPARGAVATNPAQNQHLRQEQLTEVVLAKTIHHLEKRWYLHMTDDERRAFSDDDFATSSQQGETVDELKLPKSPVPPPLPLLAFGTGPAAVVPRRSAFVCFASSRLDIPLHGEILARGGANESSSSSPSSESPRTSNSVLAEEVKNATTTRTRSVTTSETTIQHAAGAGCVASVGGDAPPPQTSPLSSFATTIKNMSNAIEQIAREWNESLTPGQRCAVELIAEREQRLAATSFSLHYDDLKKLWKPK